MKLRLRSFETKETFKVEIPNPCSYLHLQELVFQKLPSPPPSIYFSLNRKDQLTTSSPEDSIQSIGIASGDLIYFTTNPNGFSTAPQIAPPNPQTLEVPNSAKQVETLKTPDSEETSEAMESISPQITPPATLKSEQSQNPQTLENPNSTKQVETLNTSDSEETAEAMEIDDDTNPQTEIGKSFSVPGFLRKVFTEELGDDSGISHKLLGIAVHAVLLESGFVEIHGDHKLKLKFQENFYLHSFYYTLPEIIASGTSETVKIKFQNIGKYCKVYGLLVNGTSTTVHSVLLDKDQMVLFLNVVWANCGQVVGTMNENNLVSTISPEKEVFEFWRKMKDGIALPLLMDLCEKGGLVLPPCFTRLPTELKLKILELVPGVDVAKVSCVSSELRYLGSSEDLWKQKYEEQFGKVAEGSGSFKERFGRSWVSRKRRKLGVRRSHMGMMRRRPFGIGGGQFPRIIGGDYDLFPRLALPGGMRNVVPNCDFSEMDHSSVWWG